jgi:ribosomal protein S18 acetylase RimI-like enzyme
MIHINKINKNDCDIIYNLNQIIFKDEILYDKEFIKDFCIQKLGFIVNINNNPCGYILYDNCFTHEINKNVMTIVSIGVLKGYRNKGIGSLLLKKVFQLLKNDDLYLHVRVSKDKIINFYKKNNFLIEKKINNYYNLIKDGYEDAYLMKKISFISMLKNSIKDTNL